MNRVLELWLKGRDTLQIALELQMAESDVYNFLSCRNDHPSLVENQEALLIHDLIDRGHTVLQVAAKLRVPYAKIDETLRGRLA